MNGSGVETAYAHLTTGGTVVTVGEKLEGLSEIALSDPIRSIGVLVDFASDRIQREVRPDHRLGDCRTAPGRASIG